MRLSAKVGIIANPASARDIRRIVAHGGATTTYDKLNLLRRVMSGLGAIGVGHVISMADRAGVMAGLAQASTGPSAKEWPTLEFVEQEITHSAADTTAATQAMVNAGVGAIVVLGGDGTNRVVAAACGDTPIVPISTGTNNAFPRPVEATVAGIAAGLVALNPCCRRAGTYQAKKLEVRIGDRVEHALVDVAISSDDAVGSGAVWDVASTSELFLCFAEPGSIGLSAIGGHVQPTSRDAASGLHLLLDDASTTRVLAPIAPGLTATVGIGKVSVLEAQSAVAVESERGVIAIDGERMLRFGPSNRPTITLAANGPVVVNVDKTVAYASRNGLFVSPPGSVAASGHQDKTALTNQQSAEP